MAPKCCDDFVAMRDVEAVTGIWSVTTDVMWTAPSYVLFQATAEFWSATATRL